MPIGKAFASRGSIGDFTQRTHLSVNALSHDHSTRRHSHTAGDFTQRTHPSVNALGHDHSRGQHSHTPGDFTQITHLSVNARSHNHSTRRRRVRRQGGAEHV